MVSLLFRWCAGLMRRRTKSCSRRYLIHFILDFYLIYSVWEKWAGFRCLLRYDNLGLQDVCGDLIGIRDASMFLRLPFIASALMLHGPYCGHATASSYFVIFSNATTLIILDIIAVFFKALPQIINLFSPWGVGFRLSWFSRWCERKRR